MIARLLILAGIVYLLFTARRLLKKAGRANRVETGPDRIDDVMVQDPVCNVYVPRREALHVRHRGKDIYFCGEACRDAFFRQNP
jgi:YHS domain-containing protein